MSEKNYTGIVPPQKSGKAIDTESFVELNSADEAKEFFKLVKSRLVDVNNWHKYAENISAEFKLTDNKGHEADRTIQKGDYLKIDIPGPGSGAGDGYDWVQVEAVETASMPDVESFGFRVRPAGNPLKNSDDIAHFYSTESTSSFTVTRENTIVTVAIYDRNTTTNQDVDSLVDKTRDAVIGTVAAFAFSKIQWKNLADGLIKNK